MTLRQSVIGFTEDEATLDKREHLFDALAAAIEDFERQPAALGQTMILLAEVLKNRRVYDRDDLKAAFRVAARHLEVSE